MHPISELLCQIYDELNKRGQVNFTLGKRHKEQLDSIVKTVNSNYFGKERYVTTEQKAVAYLCFIIKDHPVTDGNKRLAIFWFNVYCTINNLQLNKLPFEFDTLAVAIERYPDEMDELLETVGAILFSA